MAGRSYLVLAVVGACFDPRYDNPTCGPGGECPAGLTCIAGTCRLATADDAAIDGTLDAPVDAAPDVLTGDAPMTVVTFQQGVDGYTRAVDTYLDGANGTATRDTDSTVRWRYELTKHRSGLLRFEGIFDVGAIPTTATIAAATLTVRMEQTNADGTIFEVAIPWDGSVTYDTFGPAPGVDPADIGLMVAAAPTALGAQSVDVTASIVRWRANPAQNHGWIVVPSSTGGTGDAGFRSSNALTESDHPQLSVTYSP